MSELLNLILVCLAHIIHRFAAHIVKSWRYGSPVAAPRTETLATSYITYFCSLVLRGSTIAETSSVELVETGSNLRVEECWFV
jgi:hypothetical protein